MIQNIQKLKLNKITNSNIWLIAGIGKSTESTEYYREFRQCPTRYCSVQKLRIGNVI